MNRHLLIVLATTAAVWGVSFAGDTNFVIEFNTRWQSHNASNVLNYVTGYLATNQNSEALFARGVVAASLESWGRGATNFMHQAVTNLAAHTNYTAGQIAALSNTVTDVQNVFYGLAQDANEPTNSVPSWDTNNHAVIFNETGGEAPFLDVLNSIADPQ